MQKYKLLKSVFVNTFINVGKYFWLRHGYRSCMPKMLLCNIYYFVLYIVMISSLSEIRLFSWFLKVSEPEIRFKMCNFLSTAMSYLNDISLDFKVIKNWYLCFKIANLAYYKCTCIIHKNANNRRTYIRYHKKCVFLDHETTHLI